MKRSIKPTNLDLRKWQKKAFDLWLLKIQSFKDFLCEATPGGGKTTFGLSCSHYALLNAIAERLCVVVPTDHLKRQWALAAAKLGIDLDPDFKNSQEQEAPDYHGVVITYAQLGQDPVVHQLLTKSSKTIVILDEVHHAGDSKAWGDAVRVAFEYAILRIALSGTAFRSDDCEIPYVNYENKISKADFVYGYADAVLDRVCRLVFFPAFNGRFRWRIGNEEFDHSFEDNIDPDLVPKRLKTALHAGGNWLKNIILEAHKKLMEIRATGHPDAGGLVFAIDQKHAKEIALLMENTIGVRPAVVISDQSNASGIIEKFSKGNEPWIVCVKMISEGVDVPRLRVGVYATNVKAELFFRQMTGRFVRVLSHLEGDQHAYIYIPEDRDMVKLAKEIEEEREHALEEAKKSSGGAGDDFGDLFGVSDYTPARTGKFTPLASSLGNMNLVKVNAGISNGAKFSRLKTGEDLCVFEKKSRLRDSINNLSKKLAQRDARQQGLQKIDWHKYHRIWIDRGGKHMENETLEELTDRENWLKGQFSQN